MKTEVINASMNWRLLTISIPLVGLLFLMGCTAIEGQSHGPGWGMKYRIGLEPGESGDAL